MGSVARLGDSIQGMTYGEHAGHIPPHDPSSITGSISSNCSPNVFVNGLPLARVGSVTSESDICDSGSGVVASGSSTVFVNGHPVSRIGDLVNPHNGTAQISSGSPNVFCG
jgi:uncharacterized Zn-binding protein involved in type VI secretion